nr:hypothetical protein Q903MT_gene3205 [Picea sitchensis]
MRGARGFSDPSINMMFYESSFLNGAGFMGLSLKEGSKEGMLLHT